MSRQTDRLVKQTHGWMDIWTYEQTDGRIKQTDRQTAELADR